MVAFPRSGVGTGQCLELLPEPGSQLGGWFPAAPSTRSHSRFNPPMLGGAGGGQQPWFPSGADPGELPCSE